MRAHIKYRSAFLTNPFSTSISATWLRKSKSIQSSSLNFVGVLSVERLRASNSNRSLKLMPQFAASARYRSRACSSAPESVIEPRSVARAARRRVLAAIPERAPCNFQQ